MSTTEEPMLIKGLEHESDAVRIFRLIQELKDRQPVEFFEDIKLPWKVTFRGEPSLRHANRIAIFREFLANLLSTDLYVAKGEYGSVAVSFVSADSSDIEYVTLSEKIAKQPEYFSAVIQKLGVSEVEYNGTVVLQA